MPFEKPFKETYDAGELVYGLENERKGLMKKFGLDGPNMRTVDLTTINNYTTTGNEKASLDSKIQFARGPMKLSEKETRDEIDRFNTALKQHGKYATAVDWEPGKLKGDAASQAENEAWRRKCKGGLYYACFVKQSHVHFCVDGMNFEEVVKKNYVKEGNPVDVKDSATGAKFRAITNAELRWIYRNRDHDEVKKHVQFWTQNVGNWSTCEPPWTADAATWSQYKPSHSKNVHGREDDAL
jgi:hypothetical protein